MTSSPANSSESKRLAWDRNYDAALGRFFQVDPMASKDHTMLPFAYGGNNPVNLNDPMD